MQSMDYLESFKGSDVFNLGTGRSTSVLDLINAFEKSNKLAIKYRFTKERAEDTPLSFANPAKIKEKMRWTAKKNIEEMCKDSWEALKNYS